MNIERVLNKYINIFNVTMDNYINSVECPSEILTESMKYSLMSYGKRIRPSLMFAFYELCGGNPYDIAGFGCALEMIHTYSLIHDDLPCMDNDEMRRGKPSNHIAYGEDIAVLAGDALITQSFEIMFLDKYINCIGSEKVLKAAKILAQYSGSCGMVAGQMLDIRIDKSKMNQETMLGMYKLKTGKLISAACEMGATLFGADISLCEAAKIYGESLGIAFQIVDDILDLTGTQGIIGKPVGSDADNGKITYVSLYGVEKARDMAEYFTDKAICQLNKFEGDIGFLSDFAKSMVYRVK